MRNVLFLLTVISTSLFLTSCEDIYFQQPQPIDKKEIYKMPKKLQGRYSFLDQSLNNSDDEPFDTIFPVENGYPNLEGYKLLNIYPKMVTIGYRGKLEFTSNQTKKLKKMGWTIDTIAKMFSVKIENLKESYKDGFLVYNYNVYDTLINISGGDVVKKYKCKLYLNHKDDNQKWVVYQLQKSGKQQIILRSVNKDDEDILKTLRPDDNRLYNLTKKEFKVFLKKGGFQEIETYNRE